MQKGHAHYLKGQKQEIAPPNLCKVCGLRLWKGIKIKPIDTTYQSVKQILEEARKKAYSAVNFAMVQAYWSIGRIIVEEEQKGKAKAGYGEYLLKSFRRGSPRILAG